MAELRTTSRPPSSDTFDVIFAQALEGRGFGLAGLQDRLAARGVRISLATLSYWRSGQRRPERPSSLEAVDSIEDLLDLPAGTLRNRLGPSRRPGPSVPTVPSGSSAPQEVPILEALDELGLTDLGQRMVEETLHIRVDVNADQRISHLTTRTMLRATSSGVQHWFQWLSAEDACPEPVELESVFGAEIGRRVIRPSSGFHLWELLLPRPLQVGETTPVETTARIPALSEPDTLFGQHCDRRMREIVVWVRFDRQRRPARCVLLTQHAGETTQEVPVDVTELADPHAVARGFGPGMVGVRWEW